MDISPAVVGRIAAVAAPLLDAIEQQSMIHLVADTARRRTGACLCIRTSADEGKDQMLSQAGATPGKASHR